MNEVRTMMHVISHKNIIPAFPMWLFHNKTEMVIVMIARENHTRNKIEDSIQGCVVVVVM